MIGRTLSHYQITAELGSGAMGVVYRAEDTRLGRDVALKVLPVEMAADPERLERFKREAQAIAALNHPNIVTIHSVEEADGIHLLTMELVEGKSLDQVLPPGGFELDKLFPLAIQIADALAAAHEKGIVHRDLKPANVMVTEDSRVKVLDLGLAKLAEQEHEAEETQLMTQEGMVLGTVPYMSPEQVQAQSVDHLSDIFSFGILLYEMACGQRPFQGDNAASVISAVLKEQPPSVTQLRAHLPNHLGRIVRRCLEKQPQRRYQSAREIHLELEGLQSELRMSEAAVVEVSTAARAAASETTAARSPARWIGAIAAAVVVGALAASAVFWLRVDRALEPSPVRTTIDIPAGLTLDLADRAIALSADGTQLALVLEEPTSGQQQLFVRSLDLLELRPLAGTEEATYPFWAPDGRALGFFAGSKLKRIDLQSGLVRTLADAPAGRGGAWSELGDIVFQPEADGTLFQVSADGGTVSPFTPRLYDAESHRLPHFLRGGRNVVFQRRHRGGRDEKAVYAFEPQKDELTKVLETSFEAFFVEPGGLVFLGGDGNLMSQPFDPDQLKLSGVARPIASGVHHHVARRFLSLGLTASGRLVYAETPKLPDLHLYWLDRDGAERAARAEPVDTRIIGARVSPDGGRVALSTEDANSFFSLKTLDFGGGALTPVGDPQTFAFGGVWSPDGSELIATLVADGHYYDLARVRAQAGGERRWLHSSPEFETAVGDFTPGGRWFLYGRWSVGDKLGDLMLVDTHGKEPERTYIGGPGDENWPQLSPDGRLAAYVSGASGNLEVWVADFPDARNRRQVSTRFRESEGGRTGQTIRSIGLGWMADDEIYWQDLEGRVTATTILTEGDELAVGPQRPLFGGRALDDREILLDFSIARDRFLLARASGPPPSARLVFVSDWRAGLGRSE